MVLFGRFDFHFLEGSIMKRYAIVAITLAAGLSLSACGNAEKEKAMQGQIDTCTKDKAASDAKVAELTAKVDQLTKDLEAAKATPTPAAEPEKGKGGKSAKATPAPKATAAAASTPAPAPAGTGVPGKLKRPGAIPH